MLSACQSLGGQILGGEGAIVVTHWSIGDRSVLPFVDRFYASMADGRSVGDALRETKLASIRDGARISDWAAITVTVFVSVTVAVLMLVLAWSPRRSSRPSSLRSETTDRAPPTAVSQPSRSTDPRDVPAPTTDTLGPEQAVRCQAT